MSAVPAREVAPEADRSREAARSTTPPAVTGRTGASLARTPDDRYVQAAGEAAGEVVRRLSQPASVAAVIQRLPDATKSPFVTTDLPKLVPATFSIDALRALMSDAEIESLVSAVGAPRFTELTTAKALPPAAIAHYKDKTDFLRTFVGANQATIDHIKDVDKIADGQIKGCHDEDNFRTAIGATKDFKRPKADGSMVTNKKGVQTPALETAHLGIGEIISESKIAKPAGVTNIKYRLRKNDNSGEMRTGQNMKTVIKGLAADPTKWAAYANEGIWNSIRAMTFDPAASSFTGTANDGGKISGYYNGGPGVDTFFIVE